MQHGLILPTWCYSIVLCYLFKINKVKEKFQKLRFILK